MRTIDADALKEKLNELHWTIEYGYMERPALDGIIDEIPTVNKCDNCNLMFDGYKR